MGIGAKMNAMAAYQGGEVLPPTQPDVPTVNAAGLPPPSAAQQQAEKEMLQQSIKTKLEGLVEERHLKKLYPPHRLEQISTHVVEHIDFVSLAAQRHLPLELAVDLCSLALYDIVIYADDSGSMAGTNWDRDLHSIVQQTAAIATLFDSDGIAVHFMNSDRGREHICTEADVMQLFKAAKPGGYTPLGTSLKKRILDPYLEEVSKHKGHPTELKPMLVVTVTDGEPSDGDTIYHVIKDTRKRLMALGFSGNEVAFQFAQVGDDEGATAFLDNLDNHPKIGQFVDATSNFEREAHQWNQRSGGKSQLTPDLYLLKLLCGAIDSSWDSKDETPGSSTPGDKHKSHKKGCIIQ